MAKKENKLTYLQMPLPQGRKAYRTVKRNWAGLNYSQTIDSGALSMESNISTLEAPYLVPSQTLSSYKTGYGASNKSPIGIFGFDNFLIVIYRDKTAIKVDYILYDADKDEEKKLTGVLQASGAGEENEYPRCVVQFNHYEESDDIVNGTYKKHLLIFPDKKKMYFELDDLLNDEVHKKNVEDGKATDDFTLYDLDATVREYTNEKAPYLPPATADENYYYRNTYACEDNNYGKDVYKYCEYENEEGKLEEGWKVSVPPNFPNIKYATVHLSRLFGVSDDGVYASGFNNYANWNLDSVNTYSESNAWCSKAQSNTKADGNFTGIINFQGHVVCFKRDFMHEIYNTKNPFRIQDVYAEGAIDHRTLQDVDGRLIFVSEDNVKIYTGSNPRIISYELNIKQYKNAVSGTDGRCYYLYCLDENDNHRLFTYDTIHSTWSEQSISIGVLGFAHNKNGTFALRSNGSVSRVHSGRYDHSWSFETDLITNETVNIKHLKKIQMLVDIPEEVNGEANDALFRVYLLYDGKEFDNYAQPVYVSNGQKGLNPVRLKLRNTANYGVKLHVEGRGYVRIHELELFMENGGDLYA